MSKIGVGVGEDFPVDENKPEPDAAEAEYLGTCHSRHQARRDAWRRFRHQMHEEWHAKRRAFRDGLNDREAAEAIQEFRARHLHHLIVGGLAVLGLAAIIAGFRRHD